jgi:formate hydrogenlyase transcriptional activator
MPTLDLVGLSAKFRALLDSVDLVARVDSAVLIQGETGTGKEVIAHAIHQVSLGAKTALWHSTVRPFRVLFWRANSRLRKRAFTGAASQTIGRFQIADRGTLFLDEIGDLPLEGVRAVSRGED